MSWSGQRDGSGGRRTIPLEELQAPCTRDGCGHQNSIHTGGSKRGQYDWPIYNPTWRDASGWCNGVHVDERGVTTSCTCPYRPGVTPTAKRPAGDRS
jgi:hypothetical protein